jgi:hypothetical protein
VVAREGRPEIATLRRVVGRRGSVGGGRAALAAAFVVVALATAACSGSGGAASGTVGAAATSTEAGAAADYRQAANAACQREKDSLADLAAPDPNSSASLTAWFGRTLPAARTLADDVAGLRPPADLKGDHDVLVAALRARVGAAQRMATWVAQPSSLADQSAVRAAGAAIDRAEDDAGRAERALNLTACFVRS